MTLQNIYVIEMTQNRIHAITLSNLQIFRVFGKQVFVLASLSDINIPADVANGSYFFGSSQLPSN